ncbi:MAG: LysO family transporter, partial [Candidatus Bathyarchaeia archaeon]
MMKYVLFALTFGILTGYANYNFGTHFLDTIFSEYVFNFSLLTLLFFMGLLFGADKESVARMRKNKFKVLAFPFAVALGSIMGGFFGGMILGINVIASMGVCAGYGWYTLTGPLAGQL